MSPALIKGSEQPPVELEETSTSDLALFINRMSSLSRPLIAIMGTTGVGKSQLAVELALRLTSCTRRPSKIINADAMQTYAGLDTITNKISQEEMRGVPHLLLGCKQPGEEYVVGEWVSDALNIIDQIHSEDGIPIFVGGTSYWIQNLLLPSRLPSVQGDTAVLDDSKRYPSDLSSQLTSSLAKLPPDLLALYESLPPQPPTSVDPDTCLALHNLLNQLDPPMGSRWHWRDSRKVFRSLELMKESGRLASEVLASQEEEGIPQPRFPSLVFWLCADPSVLEERLDARVDVMLKKGLLDEIKSMRSVAETIFPVEDGQVKASYTEGIFQAIGYKEFDPYLSDPYSQTRFEQGLEDMKNGTKKYARRQIKWIRNKLLPAVSAAQSVGGQLDLFLLDATDLAKWDDTVKEVATDIASRFLRCEPLPVPSSLSTLAGSMLKYREVVLPFSMLQKRKKRVCPVCTLDPNRPVMLEEGAEWEAHLKTRGHRRLENRRPHRAKQQRDGADSISERSQTPITSQSPVASESSQSAGVDLEELFADAKGALES